MKFLNKIKRIQVHRENSLNQPTDLAEEANIFNIIFISILIN